MEDFFIRRLTDLAAQAERTFSFTYTGFVSEAEYAQYLAVRAQLPCGSTAFGGHEDAERVMLRFGDAAQFGYDEPFPIVCVHIAPAQEKFADSLSHRDFLGAVMHLGIERSEIGDILVHEKHAYLFCREPMSAYICHNIDRIKHTTVRCEITETLPEAIQPKREHVTVQAASQRIDGVIAKLCRISRGDCNALFRAGKIFVNGMPTEQNSYQLREGDTVSVRGYGKFRFLGTEGTTRKGNLILALERYI